MNFDEQISAVLARHRNDAVLLHRTYPPTDALPTNSRFGGLPALPSVAEWPRMADGTPLHFLAQIDCAAMPFRSALPDRGILFFFGRDSEEQIWDERYAGDKPWRVVYAPHASGGDPLHPAPVDLPPIGDSYPPPNWRPFLREGETAPNVHVEWPIELRRMDTWPDASALIDEDFGRSEGWRTRLLGLISKHKKTQRQADEQVLLWDAYDAALQKKRADAFYTSTGYAPAVGADASYLRNTQTALRILREDSGARAYPDRWIYISLFCRALSAALERPSARTGIQDAEARIAAAEKWIGIADAADPAAAVPAIDREAFRRWAVSLQRGEANVTLDYDVAEWIIESAKGAIRSFAHNRDRARLISSTIYDAMASFFQGDSVWGIQYSQMLGHAPSSQQARETDDPTLCLLNLASDAGLGWMFGDVGEASFWIAPEALAQRDFGQAWATLEGH
ncbi:MAG: DUF1963 domain-containing protein [Sphingopyxis sp.]|nr:DUF1963 domain-containing protein [Sphingopyxis sp.]